MVKMCWLRPVLLSEIIAEPIVIIYTMDYVALSNSNPFGLEIKFDKKVQIVCLSSKKYLFTAGFALFYPF